MATLIPLGLKIFASSAGLNSGLARAEKSIGAFASSVQASSAKLAGFGAAIAGVVAGGSLGLLVKQSMDAIDVQAKMAERIGTTTEKLVGMQHAAGLAGVSGDDFGSAMESLVRRLADAASGSGDASKALGRLGLDAKALIRQDASETFYRLSDALRNVANPAERAALAYQLFGRQGQALLNTVNQGSVALRQQALEAAKLGKTFNNIEGNQIQAANDAISRMRDGFVGVGNTIAINVAPTIERLAKHIESLTPPINAFARNFAEAMKGTQRAATDFILSTGEFVGIKMPISEVDAMQRRVEELNRDLAGFRFDIRLGPELDSLSSGTRLDKFAKWQKKLREERQRLINQIAVQKRVEAELGAQQERIDSRERYRQTVAQIRTMTAAAQNLGDTVLGKLAPAFDRFKNLRLKGVADQMQALFDSGAAVFESTRTPLERYEAELTKLFALVDRGVISTDTYLRAVKQLGDELKVVGDIAEESYRKMGDLPGTDLRGATRTGQTSADFSADRGAGKLAEMSKDVARRMTRQNQLTERTNSILNKIEQKQMALAVGSF